MANHLHSAGLLDPSLSTHAERAEASARSACSGGLDIRMDGLQSILRLGLDIRMDGRPSILTLGLDILKLAWDRSRHYFAAGAHFFDHLLQARHTSWCTQGGSGAAARFLGPTQGGVGRAQRDVHLAVVSAVGDYVLLDRLLCCPPLGTRCCSTRSSRYSRPALHTPRWMGPCKLNVEHLRPYLRRPAALGCKPPPSLWRLLTAHWCTRCRHCSS
jgi:hypothetical protein